MPSTPDEVTGPGAFAPVHLAGGGEMGELIRRLDWGRTPVGPVESWPQSLRTAVGIVLESGFGMLLCWGPRYTQFYNDGYRPILGASKHPALGKGTAETFPEIWHIIGPMFDGVMRGVGVGFEDLQLSLDRNGYLEECYFTFSYGPVRDESGGVGGVLVTATETTQRVLGERRLRSLRDLAEATAEAKSDQQVCEQAARALAGNPGDLPFACVYLTGEGRARLAGVVGLAAGTAASPALAALDDETWPLAAALAARGVVEVHDLADRFGTLPGGLWPESPGTAVILPIAQSGQEPYGVLVAGISARRALDAPYRDYLGLVAGSVASAIANARAYEAERRRAEALAEIDRAKTAFFSNVSHEFRTPLTLMLGPLEERLAAGVADAADRAALQMVQRNGLRLLRLVNTLLDFSRIEAGRADAVYEATDLATYTADLASAFRSAVEKAGLTLVVDCPPLPAPAYVDREMWEKIVLNLLSNAFKFTFEGEIAVTVRAAGDGATVAVRDTGVGIAPEELPHLFERFHRIRGARSRTHEGSGIGLALVQELVRLHGGTVSVESVPGRGSTFTVALPLGAAHLPPERLGARRTLASTALGPSPYVEEALRWLPADDAGDPEPTVPRGVLPTAGARIVVADDNADMREYVVRLLRRHWRVEAHPDGAAALAAVRADPPDLVLADVMMPGLDGFELLRALREDPATRSIPVILLSARAGEDARVEGLDAGADDYLVKPFAARELVARVNAHVQMARVRGDLLRELDLERGRLEAVLRQLPAGVIIAEAPSGRLVLANAQVEAILRHPFIPAGSVAEYGAYGGFHPDGRPYREDEWPLARAVQRGETVRDEEIVARRGDGTFVTLAVSANPVRDRRGEVVAAVVTFYDITERKQREAEQTSYLTAERESRREVEAESRAKDEFLAMLSHELRNPLGAIRSAVAVLDRIGAPDPGPVRLREIIARQTAHLTRLVDDLLDVSRVTMGKITLARAPVDLREVAGRALAAFRGGRGAGHRLALQADEPVWTSGDATRLEQILTNLLENAVKFTPAGGDITIAVAAEGPEAVLRVRDSGVGIPADVLPRVFDLFVQGDRGLHRQDGGLGIGLTLVRRLAELHGGAARATSEGPGRGTEVVVRLPRVAAPAHAPAGEAAAAAVPPRSVLIIEDNDDAREAMRLLLASAGHAVHEAATAREGLALLRERDLDVALVDVGLPDLDGYELARRIRAAAPEAGPALIAVTGYGQPEDRRRATAAGFDGHLVKPVDPDLLLRVVRSVRAGVPFSSAEA